MIEKFSSCSDQGQKIQQTERFTSGKVEKRGGKYGKVLKEKEQKQEQEKDGCTKILPLVVGTISKD